MLKIFHKAKKTTEEVDKIIDNVIEGVDKSE